MTPTTVDGSDPSREILITRVFDAPAQLLFDAWRTPAQLLKWFGPPGYPLTLCEVDFRVGGRFRFAMTGPDGQQNTPFGGTYREIVPGHKIVYDNGFEGEGAERMFITVTFDESGGRTTMTMRTLFSSTQARDDHVHLGFKEGTGAGLDQLAELLRGER